SARKLCAFDVGLVEIAADIEQRRGEAFGQSVREAVAVIQLGAGLEAVSVLDSGFQRDACLLLVDRYEVDAPARHEIFQDFDRCGRVRLSSSKYSACFQITCRRHAASTVSLFDDPLGLRFGLRLTDDDCDNGGCVYDDHSVSPHASSHSALVTGPGRILYCFRILAA